MGIALRASGYAYSQWGWTTQPLIADGNGFPKRPFVKGWQNMHLPWKPDIYGLPWEHGIGLGIILGAASSNLAVMDIDDEELGAEAIRLCANTRRVHTLRNRAHIYVTEKHPSASSVRQIQWRGRDIQIELKAAGTQVTAPPTPGYRHACPPDMRPVVVPDIGTAWTALAVRLGITESVASSGFPSAWESNVLPSRRNNSMYIEAHQLREARMPLEEALVILKMRWESSYATGGASWKEMESTIKSAYRKGTPRERGEHNGLGIW